MGICGGNLSGLQIRKWAWLGRPGKSICAWRYPLRLRTFNVLHHGDLFMLDLDAFCPVGGHEPGDAIQAAAEARPPGRKPFFAPFVNDEIGPLSDDAGNPLLHKKAQLIGHGLQPSGNALPGIRDLTRIREDAVPEKTYGSDQAMPIGGHLPEAA